MKFWRKPDIGKASFGSQDTRSRHHDGNDAVLAGTGLDAVARHPFDDRPVLPKQGRRLLDVPGIHLDATGAPPTIIRYLEEEKV